MFGNFPYGLHENCGIAVIAPHIFLVVEHDSLQGQTVSLVRGEKYFLRSHLVPRADNVDSTEKSPVTLKIALTASLLLRSENIKKSFQIEHF